MDTSETYIKMCEKAVEIQLLAPKKKYSCDIYSIGDSILTYDEYRAEESLYDAIWLPRQDQLQEMVLTDRLVADDKPIERAITLHGDLSVYITTHFDYCYQFKTMEQLWLVAVMKTKFNKVWNGEDWVK